MKAIYKYPVPIDKDFFNIGMPLGAEILAFQLNPLVLTGATLPAIWAIVETENEIVLRHFAVYDTGEKIIGETRDTNIYIGTVQIPPFVWHLFETKE